MKKFKNILFIIISNVIFNQILFSQVENIPASHNIYSFLKRMELKGIINDYYDAILPLSRKQIANFINVISDNRNKLTNVENLILDDLLIEFEYDLKKTNHYSFNLFYKDDDVVSGLIRGTFQEKEKYLYLFKDSSVNLFLNGLLNVDFRRFTGTNLTDNASFIEGGIRLRGSIQDKLGYYFMLTNAQFWGNRNVLKMDKKIRQSYALYTLETKNFDFFEGYIKFQAGSISAQIGRERIFWGRSYGDKLYISDYARIFDAIRTDFEYKFLKYTFLHGWLNGSKNYRYIPEFNSYEPVASDKFIAAHRLDIAFTNYFQFGIHEFEIYSNRSVDLGYLNPISFFESVQRSRGERDNGFLGFDLKFKPMKNLEFHTDLFFDDIEIPMLGKNRWDNKYALQFGLMAVDPLGLKNFDFVVEYTQIDPYVFSHNRSLENSFANDDVLLGTQIGPNAISWYFKLNSYLSNRLTISTSYEFQRSGENIYDLSGNIIKNVGGDFRIPLRIGIDQIPTKLLDGQICDTHIFQIFVSYEFINEFYLDLRYKRYESKLQNVIKNLTYHDYGITLRIDF